MNDHPLLFTVIIPVFNNEDFIQQTLESVFRQIDDSVEVIIINDGSTDNSAQIIQHTMDMYAGTGHIRLINQQNAGVSAARNVALDIAQGGWIGFIDGDDVWCADFWQTIKPLIQTGSADLIDFQYHYFKDNLPNVIAAHGKPTTITAENREALYEVFKKSYWHVWSRIYRRDLIGKQRFHIGCRYEDTMFTPWLYLKASHIIRLDKTLYGYRDNANGITRNVWVSDITDMVFALNNTLDEIAKQPSLPQQLMTPLIINFFSEIKWLHYKIYGFYNYNQQTITALSAASKLLPAHSLPLKRFLHMRYPQVWKMFSQLRRLIHHKH